MKALKEYKVKNLIIAGGVSANKGIRERFSELCLKENINLTIGEPIDAIGGVILKTADGSVEVNNTIEARLERFKSILRSEVAEILFK